MSKKWMSKKMIEIIADIEFHKDQIEVCDYEIRNIKVTRKRAIDAVERLKDSYETAVLWNDYNNG